MLDVEFWMLDERQRGTAGFSGIQNPESRIQNPARSGPQRMLGVEFLILDD